MSARQRSARTTRLASIFVIAMLSLLVACSRPPAAKRYELEGRVVAVDLDAHTITIAHQDVPGLMKGMTMPFTVSKANNWVFRAIAPGDRIRATLVLGDHAELQDQKIHLHQFRGKPLLLTFIYTRCPFPDYCLRMSHNFLEIMQQLQKSPQALNEYQLLSISIDPQEDTPAVLRSYGKGYVGRLDPRFQHWQFATGSPEEIRKTADFFGLAYNQKDGQIVHSLSTALIGKDGKVIKVYSGNDWKPEDVAADLIAAGG
jgi:protein SCO1